jgi:class 3 adenylate cyclase
MLPPANEHASQSTGAGAWLEMPDGLRQNLGDAKCVIGRNAPKDILLPSSFVSGSHAMIEASPEGRHVLHDLRSTNGTFLDGRRISAPSLLKEGSRIRIGPFEFVYHGSLREVFRKSTISAAPMEGTTMIQTYDGPCWLLLLDLESFTTRRQSLGQNRAEALVREWVTDARTLIDGNGGVINGQPGDALFAYWREDAPAAVLPRIDTALRSLLQLQAQTREERPFRIVLHKGTVLITSDATHAEHLASPDVDLLFRLEKQAKPLGVSCVLSEPATRALGLAGIARSLGAQPVPDFGRQTVYTVSPYTRS